MAENNFPYMPVMSEGGGMNWGGALGALLIGALLFGGIGGFGRAGTGVYNDPFLSQATLDSAKASATSQSQLDSVQGQINALGGMMNTFQVERLFDGVNNGLNRLSTQIGTDTQTILQCTNAGFTSMQESLCNGFAGVNATVNATSNATQRDINTGISNVLMNNNSNTQAIIQAINGVTSKMDANTIAALTADKSSLQGQLANCNQTQALSDQICQLRKELAECCCEQSRRHDRHDRDNTDINIVNILANIQRQLAAANGGHNHDRGVVS